MFGRSKLSDDANQSAQAELTQAQVRGAEVAQLALNVSRLADAYAKKKISRASYRRQRKALLAYRAGQLSALPEFCFNEFSQHHIEGEDAHVAATVSNLSKAAEPIRGALVADIKSADIKKQGAPNIDMLVALICLLCGGVVGVLLILFFDS